MNACAENYGSGCLGEDCNKCPQNEQSINEDQHRQTVINHVKRMMYAIDRFAPDNEAPLYCGAPQDACVNMTGLHCEKAEGICADQRKTAKAAYR